MRNQINRTECDSSQISPAPFPSGKVVLNKIIQDNRPISTQGFRPANSAKVSSSNLTLADLSVHNKSPALQPSTSYLQIGQGLTPQRTSQLPRLSEVAALSARENPTVEGRVVIKKAFREVDSSVSDTSSNVVYVAKSTTSDFGSKQQLPAFLTSMPTFTNVIDQHRFQNLNRSARGVYQTSTPTLTASQPQPSQISQLTALLAGHIGTPAHAQQASLIQSILNPAQKNVPATQDSYTSWLTTRDSGIAVAVDGLRQTERDRVNSDPIYAPSGSTDVLQRNQIQNLYAVINKPTSLFTSIIRPTASMQIDSVLDKFEGKSMASADANNKYLKPRERDSQPIDLVSITRLALSADSAAIDDNNMVSSADSNENMDVSNADPERMSISSGRSSTVYSNVDDARNAKIRRYWLKKQNRLNKKTVRYGCRQNLAKQRFRYQGRFITKKEMELLGPDVIYDPSSKHVPKVKHIFKVTKEHNRSRSCRSTHSDSAGDSKPLCLGTDSSDSKNDLISYPADYSSMLPIGQMRLFNSTKKVTLENQLNSNVKDQREISQIGSSVPFTAQDILMDVDQQDVEDQQDLTDFARQADGVGNLFSVGLPMADQPSQSDITGGHETMQLMRNPVVSEADQLMSAMNDQSHVVPTSNLGGFMNVAEINQKIGMLSKTLQEAQPLKNFTATVLVQAHSQQVNQQQLQLQQKADDDFERLAESMNPF